MSAITSWRIVALQRPEHRLERRERVVGHLGMRAGQAREQRGLTGVGKPDQPDVGQQLQLQRQPGLLAGKAALGEPRGLVRGPGEALVAAPAGPAAGDQRALTGADEVVAGAVASTITSVPGGTRISVSSPSAPWRSDPCRGRRAAP